MHLKIICHSLKYVGLTDQRKPSERFFPLSNIGMFPRDKLWQPTCSVSANMAIVLPHINWEVIIQIISPSHFMVAAALYMLHHWADTVCDEGWQQSMALRPLMLFQKVVYVFLKIGSWQGKVLHSSFLYASCHLFWNPSHNRLRNPKVGNATISSKSQLNNSMTDESCCCVWTQSRWLRWQSQLKT